jgi:hypothetical protein
LEEVVKQHNRLLVNRKSALKNIFNGAPSGQVTEGTWTGIYEVSNPPNGRCRKNRELKLLLLFHKQID